MQAHSPSFAALDADHGVEGSSPTALPYAQVSVVTDPREVAKVWEDLEQIAPVSPYQTLRWMLPWLKTEGGRTAIKPMIVTAMDHRGAAVALLPLAIRTIGQLRVAGFMGGKHANYNMGLFQPGIRWTQQHVTTLLRQAAAQAGTRIDLYAFANQPADWMGAGNPLALLPGHVSPSASHRADLSANPDDFFKIHHSSHSRKTLRSKRTRLETLGPVSHRMARSEQEIEAVLNAYLDQKAAKLAAMGVSTPDQPEALRAFMKASALGCGGRSPALELHALFCGDRIAATFAGVPHAGRFSGTVISYDAAPDIGRSSPGELLLCDVIAEKCRQGFTSFDLGIGEARYKESYCRITDPLFDSFLPITILGRAYLVAEASRLRIKGAIKRSPRAWAAVTRLRRLRSQLPAMLSRLKMQA